MSYPPTLTLILVLSLLTHKYLLLYNLQIFPQKFNDTREVTAVEKRLNALRNEMRTRTVSSRGTEIDAYIVTSYDEHQIYQSDDLEGRLQFISGFSGPIGDAVVIYIKN
jgi:hypothetical protein